MLAQLAQSSVGLSVGSIKNAYDKSVMLAKIAGDINNIMSDLAEQEFANARQALRDAQTSSNPRHELTNAINHLQSAASSFESRISLEYKKTGDWFGRGGTDYWKIAQYKLKRVECFALITFIYFRLQESSLVDEYVNKYVNALATYIDDRRATNVYSLLVSTGVFLDGIGGYRWSRIEAYEKKYGVADIRNSQGLLYFNAEKYDKALTLFQESVQEDAHKSTTYTNQGAAFYKLGRMQEAIEACDKAIQISPDGAVNHFWRGCALYSLRRYREAAQDFNEAVRLDPSNSGYQEWARTAINQI